LYSAENQSLYCSSSVDFTRNSVLDFPTVALSILKLFKESIEFVSQGVLSELYKPQVTGSAFSQARYKIKPEFFRDLSKLTVEHAANFQQPRWKNYRILAGDGSTVNLPPSKQIREYFGIQSNSKGLTNRSIAGVFLVYDVLSGLTISQGLGKTSTGESGMLDDCLSSIPQNPGDLLTLDRYFGNFYRISKLLSQQRAFCIRMSVGGCGFAKRVMADSRADFIALWEPSKKERENTPGAKPITVRVTKTVLESGIEELLVSSLTDMDEISTEEMVKLYFMRWGIEEGIKNLKPKMKIEHFGCRKPEGIYQEFHAHILVMNMVALTGLAASEQIEKKTKHRKLVYKYNWMNAYRYVRDRIVGLFSISRVEILLDELISLVSSSLIPILPGRAFSRAGLDRKNPKNSNYK